MSSRNSNFSNPDQNDEDDEWLFESIVAFLASPIWSIPIQHFIEQHCTGNFNEFYFYQSLKYLRIYKLKVFSPSDGWSGSALLDDGDEEIDLTKVPQEYLQIYSKYKELVRFQFQLNVKI